MGRQFTVRGAHPDPRWQPGEPDEAKGTRCIVRGGAHGRISHAYTDPAMGRRCYVVLDSGQSGWFPIGQIEQLDPKED